MKEALPEKLIDTTTVYKHHTWLTHLFCILIRVILGSFLILNTNIEEKKGFLIILMISIILIFSNKFITNSDTWKVYLRTTVAYSIALLFTYQNHYKEAGFIVLTDALMGIQSRHTGVLFNIMRQ